MSDRHWSYDIDDLCKVLRELSDYDKKFVMDMVTKLKSDRPLPSQKQVDMVRKIWSNHCRLPAAAAATAKAVADGGGGNKPPDIKDWRAELDDLCDVDDGLSNWEMDFIDDLARLAEVENFIPTARQKIYIGKLWMKHCY